MKNYNTFFQTKKHKGEKTRLICLAKISQANEHQIQIRRDLMSNLFPSIWVELIREGEKNILICGYYREWTINGTKITADQIKAIQELTRQMELAEISKLPIIMMGDMNLCSTKWSEPDFLFKHISEEIQSSLAQCGLVNQEIGYTYLADRLSDDGSVIQSALDHIYISSDL